MTPSKKDIGFIHALFPVAFLGSTILYGLILRPLFLQQEALSLEFIFVLASFFAVAELFFLGFQWNEIQTFIVNKLATALPAIFILFAIGVIIGSWMICGTIPMLVYYGLELIDPRFLYLICFVIPIVFSTLTGTSWGSIGTVGVVLIGIATALEANLGIATGAIVGGAYFGDKLSPLSDTTNLAALAADVDVFDHIRSMMVTTLPSSLLAGAGFFLLGLTNPPGAQETEFASLTPFLDSLQELFQFHILLLAPPVIVLIGSLRKLPAIPTLMSSSMAACVLAVTIQSYSIGDTASALTNGYHVSMASWASDLPLQTVELVNRGGLYSMSQAIFASFLIFFFIGAIDTINAMPQVASRVFGFATGRRATILATLASAGITNAMTSNQYATSLIVGDAFKSRFDKARIPRKVLSRSLEDYGTMIESIVPWTTTAIFIVATLNVPWSDYWHWQLLSLFNLILAPIIAVSGLGCFYHELESS